MPHSFVYLVIHVVFSTRDRAPHLTPDLSGGLFPYMAGIVKALQGVPFIVNGPADHVHLLLSLPAGVSIAEMLRVLKTNSSRWVHENSLHSDASAGKVGTAPLRWVLSLG